MGPPPQQEPDPTVIGGQTRRLSQKQAKKAKEEVEIKYSWFNAKLLKQVNEKENIYDKPGIGEKREKWAVPK